MTKRKQKQATEFPEAEDEKVTEAKDTKIKKVRDSGPTVYCPETGSRVRIGRCTGPSTSPGEECAYFVKITEFSVECKLKCVICDAAYASHPRCQACAILTGTNHVSPELYPYREHKICAVCVKKWHTIDELADRETTWLELMQPKISTLKGYWKEDSSG